MSAIAFLFPGQGSQAIGMGRTAANLSSAAKALLDDADRRLGYSLSSIMFDGPEERLKETVVTQPALFVSSAMALQLLRERGLAATVAAGHSLGEYSALYAAGVFDFPTALNLVRERAEAMQAAAKAQPGAMAAVIGLSAEQIEAVCRAASQPNDLVIPANFNTESQIVISGHAPAVKRAMDEATKAGAAKVVPLAVSGAFHSPLMSAAAERLKKAIDAAAFRDAAFPVVTNVDAKPTTAAAEFKEKLVRQLDHAVLWHETLKGLMGGTETFIEVGSGRVLSTMARKLDRKKTVLATDDLESIDKTFGARAGG